jgi:2-hydroxychromene-2-carboxylate isomerase
MAQSKITFYVDIISPFAYLAFSLLKVSTTYLLARNQYVQPS